MENQPQSLKKTPLQMIKLAFSSLRPNPKKQEPAEVQVTSPQPLTSSQASLWNHAVPPTIKVKTKFEKKSLLLILAAVLIIAVAALLIMNFSSRLNSKPLSTPIATLEPTPKASPIPLTKYATDSAVLKIEQDLKNLDGELGGVDIDEDSLKPRPLKWDVNFK